MKEHDIQYYINLLEEGRTAWDRLDPYVKQTIVKYLQSAGVSAYEWIRSINMKR